MNKMTEDLVIFPNKWFDIGNKLRFQIHTVILFKHALEIQVEYPLHS